MANFEGMEYLNQARSFVAMKQYDDALEYIDKAIQTDKFNKEFMYKKALYLPILTSIMRQLQN